MPSCERYYPSQEKEARPVAVIDNEHDPDSLGHKLKVCKEIAATHFGIDEQYADWHDGWSGEHFLALLDLTCLRQHYNRPGYAQLRDEMSSLTPDDWSEILKQTEVQSLVNFIKLKEDSYDRHLSPFKPEATALLEYVEDMDKQQATEALDWLRSRIVGGYSHHLAPDDLHLLLARKNGRDFTRAEFLGRAIHTWFDGNGQEHVYYDVNRQELDRVYEMGGDQTILVLLRSKYFDCQPRKMAEALGRIVGDQALEEAWSIVSSKPPYKKMKQSNN